MRALTNRSSIRSLLAVATLFAATVALSGCKKEGDSGSGSSGAASAAIEKVVASWKAAGLDPSTFTKVDAADFGGGECESGKVSGIETTLCYHPTADKAKSVRAQAVKKVGSNTGYALVNGELVLVVADRGKSDPSGRTMNKMARAFQGK
jgi:hypothetical protein